VSVFLKRAGDVVAADVLTDTTSVRRATIVTATLGAMGALILATLGARLSYVLLWLLWAIAGGLMLGLWLTGQMHRQRMRHLRGTANSRLAREVEAGRAVVVAVVDSANEAHIVEDVFESAGGTLARERHPAVSHASLRQ
jgi:hypothetical protein